MPLLVVKPRPQSQWCLIGLAVCAVVAMTGTLPLDTLVCPVLDGRCAGRGKSRCPVVFDLDHRIEHLDHP